MYSGFIILLGQIRFVFRISIFILFFLPQYVSADTYFSGMINQDTTWNVSGSPYILIGDVTIGKETFADMNNNRQWDALAEGFSDIGFDRVADTNDSGEGNGRYDDGEPFTDHYPNDKWDPYEPFTDLNGNHLFDGIFTLKITPGVEIKPQWDNCKVYTQGVLIASGASFKTASQYQIDIQAQNDSELHLSECSIDSGTIEWLPGSRGSLIASAGTSEIKIKSADVAVKKNTLHSLSIFDSAPVITGNTFTSPVPYVMKVYSTMSGISGNTYISKNPMIQIFKSKLNAKRVIGIIDGIRNYGVYGNIKIESQATLTIDPGVVIQAIKGNWHLTVEGILNASEVSFIKPFSHGLDLNAISGGQMNFTKCQFDTNKLEWDLNSRGSIKSCSGTPETIIESSDVIVSKNKFKQEVL